jgi:hypothetical protein
VKIDDHAAEEATLVWIESMIEKSAWLGSLALLVAVSCGDDSVRLGTAQSGGGTGSGSSGTSNQFAGSGGRSASDGSSSSVGGTGFAGVAGTSADGCTPGERGWCAEDVTRHGNWRADVIAVVDTSPSMAAEVAEVQASLNGFAERIQAAQIDLKLALIAAPPSAGATGPSICVPAPLGSGSCPPQGEDTLLPRLFHHPGAVLDERVDLVAALWLASYDLNQFLRPGVKTAVVIVSDSDGPTALPDAYGNPDFVPRFNQTQFSALYAFSSCPNARAEGSVYRDLVARTEGAQGDLCSEPISSALERVADAVIAQQMCEVSIGMNSNADWSNVRVFLARNATSEQVARVPSRQACDPERGGWYVTARNTESYVRHLCPATCEAFRSDPESTVRTQIACQSILPPC